MRSPQSSKFQRIQSLMRSGQMIGKDRPVTRATWAKQSLQQINSTKDGVHTVRYLAKNPQQYEFTGIQTVEIQRSIGQDAATCTITAYNTHTSSSQPEGIDTAGRRGYLSPGRGDVLPAATSVYSGISDDFGMGIGTAYLTFPTQWGYPQNPYRDVFIPNTVIRTYQGYGSDNFDQMGNEMFMHDPDSDGYVPPEKDTQLYLTGTWLIDQVTFDAQADTLTIEMRDLGKLLIEQYVYPPLLPIDRFPLIYCPDHPDEGVKESIGANMLQYDSASTDAQYGFNGSVLGHRGTDSVDGNGGTFWLSGPNSVASDVEWIQYKCNGPINELVLNAYGGNYQLFICIHVNGVWLGSDIISGVTENLKEGQSPGNNNPGYIYVIVPGDTLWDLAGTYYGKNTLWPIIAQANSDIIKDPHWIYPGQRIKIPYVAGTKLPPPPPDMGWTGTGGTQVAIPYVLAASVPSDGNVTIPLNATYDADYVRLVFKGLQPSFGPGSPFRCGVIEVNARLHIPDSFVPSDVGQSGKIHDWTEPIKEMSAWAGFAWEPGPDGPETADPVIGEVESASELILNQSALAALQAQLALPHNTAAVIADLNERIAALEAAIAGYDPAVPTGPLRVWGDFEILGAGPIACTPGDYFMSKSFMDAIRQIVDFIGGIFFVDESGGVQFRLPNIWTGGNFINDTDALSSLSARISEHPIEFHEDVNLLTYSTVISDASVRSEILVVGYVPDVYSSTVAGGYVLGFNGATGETSAIDFTDVLAGQYRIMIAPGDATNLFQTEEECQRMAELTALFILFTYRQSSSTIPGHPALQLDDQVRIFERSTYETNVHYVSTIDSKHDLEKGQWTMTVTSHWLGGDPDTDWFVDKANLTPAVLQLPAILDRIGTEAAGDQFEQLPYTS